MFPIPSEWFLPGHSALAILSIFFIYMVSFLGWSAHTSNRPRNLIFMSCFFLSVGLLDFIHTMSYEGMPDFITPNSTHKAIIFWLGARLIAAFTLLAVVCMPWKPFAKHTTRYICLITSLSLCGLLVWTGLYREHWIPNTFIAGSGLTPFKIGVEVGIMLILLLIMAILLADHRRIEGIHKGNLLVALCFMVISGICFIFYTQITDLMNFVGHLFKIVAYFFIYQSVLKDSVHVPFAKLVQSEKEMIQCKEKFSNTLHSVKEAVIVTDEFDRIEFINSSAQQMTQWPETEALGKKTEAVIQIEKYGKEAMSTLTTKSGTKLPIEFSVFPITGRNGSPIGTTYMIRDGTKQLESRKTIARLLSIVEHAADFIATANPQGNILYCNEKARSILGIESEQLPYLTTAQVYPKWALELVRKHGLPAAIQESFWMGETALLDKNEQEIPVSQTIVAHKNTDGEIEFYSSICRDLTERKKAEQRDKLSAKLFESMSEGFMITDAKHTILQVNFAFVAITGYEENEVLGKTPHFLSSGWHKPEFYAEMWKSIQETSRWSGQIWNRHKNGDYYLEEITISGVSDQSTDYTYYVAVFKDITEKMKLEAKLFHQESHDILTDLPIRMTLYERFEQAKQYVQKHELIVCIMYIVIDNLRQINDKHGHSTGEQLLKMIARRLEANARASSTVARIGGDEFMILLPDLRRQSDYTRVAEKTCEIMSQPFDVISPSIKVAFNIGICFYPDHGDTLDVLIKNANHAVQQAKCIRPNQYQLFAGVKTQMNDGN